MANEETIIYEENAKPSKRKIEKEPSLSQKIAPQLKAFGLEPKDVALEANKLKAQVPALAAATGESLLLGVAVGLASGVSLNPQDGQFALIPYSVGMKKVAQVQFMWKGYKNIIETLGEGVKELKVIEIKDLDEDILSVERIERQFEDHLSINGEFKLKEDIEPTTITEIIARRKR